MSSGSSTSTSTSSSDVLVVDVLIFFTPLLLRVVADSATGVAVARLERRFGTTSFVLEESVIVPPLAFFF